MKKILAYSLMLFFVAALVAPVVSLAEDEFPTNKGQRAAEGSDPKEDAKESSSVVATGIACDACEKNAAAGNIHEFKKKNRENFDFSKASKEGGKADGKDGQQ
ncbi:hypothetical protein D3C72_895700 [compost metagenome]